MANNGLEVKEVFEHEDGRKLTFYVDQSKVEKDAKFVLNAILTARDMPHSVDEINAQFPMLLHYTAWVKANAPKMSPEQIYRDVQQIIQDEIDNAHAWANLLVVFQHPDNRYLFKGQKAEPLTKEELDQHYWDAYNRRADYDMYSPPFPLYDLNQLVETNTMHRNWKILMDFLKSDVNLAAKVMQTVNNYLPLLAKVMVETDSAGFQA